MEFYVYERINNQLNRKIVDGDLSEIVTNLKGIACGYDYVSVTTDMHLGDDIMEQVLFEAAPGEIKYHHISNDTLNAMDEDINSAIELIINQSLYIHDVEDEYIKCKHCGLYFKPEDEYDKECNNCFKLLKAGFPKDKLEKDDTTIYDIC